MLVIITLPAVALLFLQNSKIQNRLTSVITTELSEYLGTRIEVDEASITFFNRFQLKNVYMEDLNGDTLLFSDKVKVTLNHLNRSRKDIGIKRLVLKEADIHLIATDSTGVNLNFIIEEVKNPDKPESEKWDLKFDNIRLDNSRFRYTHPFKENKGRPIDFTAMDLRDLNLNVSDLTKNGDTVSFNINKLFFKEKSGFTVHNINSKLSLSKTHMHYNNAYIETPLSSISANSVYFNFETYRNFKDFVNKVNIHFSFRSSSVNFEEISYFTPGLEDFSETFRISGILEGKINDLTADKILVAYSDETILGGSMNVFGLPDVTETFMHLNIDMFQTSIEDLKKIQLPGKKRLSIPDELKAIGTITYSGKFTGYYDDFVAYGNFDTDLGSLATDLAIKPHDLEGLNFKGNLSTHTFSLGKLIPNANEILGKLSVSAEVDGSFHKNDLVADLSGNVRSLELYGYSYENINLEGILTEETFDGSMDISDPNIELQFQGKVDFSKEQPQFNFITNVSRLRPYYLNLNRTDPSYFASFLMETNFSGIHPDSINGEIKLVNSFFQRSGEQIQIYDLTVKAENSSRRSALSIRSDIMDADISGNFSYSRIPQSLENFAHYYLPSFINGDSLSLSDIALDESDIDYSISFKEIENIVSFFSPDYLLSDESYISGRYHPSEYEITMAATIPAIGFKDHYWTDLHFIAEADSSGMEYTGISNELIMSKDLGVENFYLGGRVYHDTIITNISWNSTEGPEYSGNLNLLAKVGLNNETENSRIFIETQHSDIIFNDTLWHIPPSVIHIDSSSILVDSFIINNQNQALILAGEISHKQDSRLQVNFSELDLATFNTFTKASSIEMGGALSGQASLINAYEDPVFLSDLIVSNFFLNGQDFGEANLRALWNHEDKRIHMLTSGIKGGSRIYEIEGDYYPLAEKVDFDIFFDKIRLSTFEPFADKLVSDIRGLGSGNLNLKGSLKEPKLNGDLNLFKASVIVDYLQTRYSFSDKLKIEDNKILLDNFKFRDATGNNASARGVIHNNNFKDFNLDISVSTSNFRFLNTSQADNELFYGRVLASGIIDITGPPDNLFMEINARTEKNSVFNIPLYGADEVNENHFIKFVNSNGNQEEKAEEEEFSYEVDLKGLTMEFNLEITPEAEVQIIFDPSIGDILQGRGRGNLNMSINTLGEFEMYGDMIIEEGDYLFTLQNLINKKLEVEPGGRITWNGDPSDAIIDLKAVYNLRTSVATLTPDTPDERLNKRIPVQCQILLSGKLLQPNIKTDIVLPTTDQQTRNIVNNSINTEEEKLKQFISLLVMNSFMSPDPGAAFLAAGSTGTGVAGVATSELLSNQVSHLLSQISQDFDIGLNYRPGDQITTDELEVALSTQILDDRITIAGNLDVGGNQTTQTTTTTNPNNIVGDFNIDFKLTENGKLHLKAFNRANDNILFRTSPYTQGVGVFYREDFNTFGELLRRYREAILNMFSRKEEMVSEEEETSMIED